MPVKSSIRPAREPPASATLGSSTGQPNSPDPAPGLPWTARLGLGYGVRMIDSVFQTVVRCLESGEPCVLATVVEVSGSVPRKPGAKMVVLFGDKTVGTVGGGSLEGAVIREAGALLGSGDARLLSYNLGKDLNMKCGGRAQVFVEGFCPRRMLLFGAGHVGHALFPLAVQLGFRVTVVDPRAELASEQRFPGAERLVHSFDPDQWGGMLPDPRAFAVVVTADHATDTRLVLALLPHDLAYLGMIGSRGKRRAAEKAAAEAGIDPGRVARMRTPMGLSIGAETPAEIAVSIAGELVQTLHGGDAEPMTKKKE